MTEIQIAGYAGAALMMVLLAITYKIFDFSDKSKPLIAGGLGILLGIAALFYNEVQVTVKSVIEYAVIGLMTGAAAAGLWDMTSSIKDK